MSDINEPWVPQFRQVSSKEYVIHYRYKCTKCKKFRKESEIRNTYCQCGNGKSYPIFYKER
jgi:hypothetical protein